jgi:hypothetical protein
MKKIFIVIGSLIVLLGYSSSIHAAPLTNPHTLAADTSVQGKCGSSGIDTAIGCLDVLNSSPETFLGEILRWAVGVGSGIAFLFIVYSGFLIMTASGDPKKMQAGREVMTSAISGLVLIILSVFVLNIFGVDILQLCKFGFGPAC